MLSLATLHANQTGAPSGGAPSPADLDQVVTRVLESNATYVQTFRNLAAEETKDIQQFDKSGRVNKQRRIVSDLLVYQPTRGAMPMEYAAEYRDVREVDGKPVKKRSERALDTIKRAMRSESLQRELEVIDRENHRYDLNYDISVEYRRGHDQRTGAALGRRRHIPASTRSLRGPGPQSERTGAAGCQPTRSHVWRESIRDPDATAGRRRVVRPHRRHETETVADASGAADVYLRRVPAIRGGDRRNNCGARTDSQMGETLKAGGAV